MVFKLQQSIHITSVLGIKGLCHNTLHLSHVSSMFWLRVFVFGTMIDYGVKITTTI